MPKTELGPDGDDALRKIVVSTNDSTVTNITKVILFFSEDVPESVNVTVETSGCIS